MLADHRLAVCGHRDRSIDHRPDADLVQERESRRRRHQEAFEPIEVLLEELLRKVGGQASITERAHRALFPTADRERPRFRLQIEVVVGIAKARQSRGNPIGLLGDQILMLDDSHRQFQPRQLAELPRPQSGGIDDDVAIDQSRGCFQPRDPPAVAHYAGHRHAFDDTDAGVARAFRIGMREPIRIDIAVRRNIRGADDAFRVE